MDRPKTLQELQLAIAQAPKNKSPGADGITAEFYQWGIDILQNDLLQLYNDLFATGRTTYTHARALIVCIPKNNNPKKVEDFRPLTLMNTDYKIYARITANRLKPTKNDVLHATQYSATTGRNILDAAAAIRAIIAAGKNKRGGICLITLDFKSAFDNISHEYLHGLLREYRYGADITTAIVSLYEHATSRIAINGRYTSDFQLKCSIRQGCPLSSISNELAVNPFILLLNKHPQGLQIDHQHTVACVA
jgi:hypothetical protein